MKKLAYVLFLFLAFTAAAQNNPVSQLAGRSVELSLVKADDLSPIPWPEGKVQLTQVRSTFSGDANILILLKKNGFAPDSEALTVVYDLNPTIRDISDLSATRSVELPSVNENQALRKLLQSGYLVELTVDPEIRGQLNDRIDALEKIAPSIRTITSDRNTQLQLERILGWFQEIKKRFHRRTGPPLRQSTLVEMRDEANQVYSVTYGASQEQRELTESEKQQIAAVFEDIQTEIKQYGQVLADIPPKPQSYYSVTVAIKGPDHALIDSLRVYYTFNGLFRPLPAEPPIKSFGFKQLGSGKTENLLMKNYQIWAAKDGDANHPLTPPYALRIDDASLPSFSIELSLGTQP